MLEVVAADDPDRDNLSAKLIFERARQGDPLAIAQTEIEAELLGIGVANLVTLFAPDVIALGGNLMNAEDLLMAGIRKVVGRNCGLVPFHATTIKRVSFQDHAGLVGAAAAWLHQFGERAACAA
jgi:glucokinase